LASRITLIANSVGELVTDPEKKYRNRTLDLLFRSLAAAARERAIGVVLSGSLDDGSRGLAAIHEAHGVTMVLTSTAGEQGMPENAADYDGPIDVIGNPRVIAEAIRQAITAMSVFTEMAAGPAGAA
jgi:two-component system chemotaxis response regulator CheB